MKRFVYVLFGLVFLFLLAAPKNSRAEDEPASQIYIPIVGYKTPPNPVGPHIVKGRLFNMKTGDVWYCQTVYLAELHHYNPDTGEGIIVYDTAFSPADITNKHGEFTIVQVVDHDGNPIILPVMDFIPFSGRVYNGAIEGLDYDILEDKIIQNLYNGMTVDIGDTWSKPVLEWYPKEKCDAGAASGFFVDRLMNKHVEIPIKLQEK